MSLKPSLQPQVYVLKHFYLKYCVFVSFTGHTGNLLWTILNYLSYYSTISCAFVDWEAAFPIKLLNFERKILALYE